MKHAPRGPIKSKDLMPVTDHTPVGPTMKGAPIRCSARTKATGQPCRQLAIKGATVCKMHGGMAPQVLASARERLMALQPLAIQTMHNLMNRDEYPTVQLGAARDVLDRTEGKPVESVSLTGANNGPLVIEIHKPW